MTSRPGTAPVVSEGDHERPDHEHGSVLRKNIRAIADLEERVLHQRGAADRLSDAISRAMGSGPFALFHIIGFSAWFVLNTRLLPGIQPFDPYPFYLLTLV